MIQPDVKNIDLHFLIAKERTGSTLLFAILNSHPQILSTSEEPFFLYLNKKFKNVVFDNIKKVDLFFEYFWNIQENNLDLYYTNKKKAKESIIEISSEYISKQGIIDYLSLCKIIYLHFLPQKKKDTVKIIVDKQLKFAYHLNTIKNITPNSKFIFLVRDPKANVYSCCKRKIENTESVVYHSNVWKMYTSKVLNNNIEDSKKLIIHYEDLVNYPLKTLNKIYSFLNVPLIDSFSDYSKHFNEILNESSKQISQKFKNNLKDFHSGLLNPIDKKYLSEWKNNISDKNLNKIDKITFSNAKKLGYDSNESEIKLSIADWLFVFYSYLKKIVLLRIYYITPLSIKILIKKFKKTL